MRMQEAFCWLCILLCAPAMVAGAQPESTQELFYAIEQDGVVCGYAHVIITQAEFAGRPTVQLIDSLWMQMSVLGKSIEGKYRFEYRIDPKDGMYFYHTSAIDQGGAKLGGIMEVRGDSMVIVSEPGSDTTVVALPPGTIRQNTRIHRYLIDFFVKDTLTQKT